MSGRDPLTMRYLHGARKALTESLRQTDLAIERDGTESELRVLYALSRQDDGRIQLRRALNALEYENGRTP